MYRRIEKPGVYGYVLINGVGENWGIRRPFRFSLLLSSNRFWYKHEFRSFVETNSLYYNTLEPYGVNLRPSTVDAIMHRRQRDISFSKDALTTFRCHETTLQASLKGPPRHLTSPADAFCKTWSGSFDTDALFLRRGKTLVPTRRASRWSPCSGRLSP